MSGVSCAANPCSRSRAARSTRPHPPRLPADVTGTRPAPPARRPGWGWRWRPSSSPRRASLPAPSTSRLAAASVPRPRRSSAPKFPPRLAGRGRGAVFRLQREAGGGSSADDLWRRWNDLRKRQLGALDELTPAVKPVAGPAVRLRLLAGEFRNAAAAGACGALRARFLACDVVLPLRAPDWTEKPSHRLAPQWPFFVAKRSVRAV